MEPGLGAHDAARRTVPSGACSEMAGTSPQPLKTLPLGRTWELPWELEIVLKGGRVAERRVAVLDSWLRAMILPEERG
jgi:hypothetical protein